MSRKTVLLFLGQAAYRGRCAIALKYPVAVFTEDVELEADLGVDSVKQTELLSHAADRYQLPARPTDFQLSDDSTMSSVSGFAFGALTAPAAQFGAASYRAFSLTRARHDRRHQK